jgi:hypothetical protein
MNPIEEFLQEKQAFMMPPTAQPGVSGAASDLGRMFLGGLGAGAATAAVAGAAIGAKHIYQAATKSRDFKQMLEFDPELKQMHRENPKYINAGFSTLRRLNPEFSSDPMVSSAFVKNVAMGETAGAFNLAQEALRSRPDPSALEEAFVSGARTGVEQSMKGQQDVMMDQLKGVSEEAMTGRRERFQQAMAGRGEEFQREMAGRREAHELAQAREKALGEKMKASLGRSQQPPPTLTYPPSRGGGPSAPSGPPRSMYDAPRRREEKRPAGPPRSMYPKP